MHCDDDLYGIKNITHVHPPGKVTAVNYSRVPVPQTGFSHKNNAVGIINIVQSFQIKWTFCDCILLK